MMNTIKKILQKDKSAHIIIIEENKPSFVVSSFEEYERMLEGRDLFSENGDFLESDDFLAEIPSGEENVGDVNQEIISLAGPEKQDLQIIEETIEDLPYQAPQRQEEIDEVRIEDIPLL